MRISAQSGGFYEGKEEKEGKGLSSRREREGRSEKLSSSSREESFKTHIVSTEVGLHLSSEDLESCRLSDTVGSYETENLTWTRSRQTMKFERVGGVPMGDLRLEVGGKVDDGDGFEGASARGEEG